MEIFSQKNQNINMDLENYTNLNIFKRTFEQKEISNSNAMIEQPHNIIGDRGVNA